jgi:hypothetical protein
MRPGFLHARGREENITMLDDILDLLSRDRKRQRPGFRGLLDRLADRDDDHSHTRKRRHDDWDDDERPAGRDARRRQRESADLFD